ncbi:MAG TPA: hypothetical protein VFM09_05130 [Marmoricola sp.]|nr:hypothetical protein [Marmoricola sp.]
MKTTLLDVLRGLCAAGVLLSGVVHLDVWFAGVRGVSVLGPLFLLNFVGGLALGVGVVAWRHWLTALLAAGYAATTLVFFYISVVHGLFGVHETLTGWSQVLAQVAELTVLVCGLVVVALSSPVRRRGAGRVEPPTASLRVGGSTAARGGWGE